MSGTAWGLVAGLVGGLAVSWITLIGVLWARRPDELTVGEAARLLPDLVRMLHGLAGDPALPRRARWWLWGVIAYLASPIDLVPDVLPVVGVADDAVAVALVLRAVTRRAGAEALERHWPGSDEGLGAVRSVAGL